MQHSIATANVGIEQATADDTTAYSNRHGIATAACAGPGQPPAPSRHISNQSHARPGIMIFLKRPLTRRPGCGTIAQYRGNGRIPVIDMSGPVCDRLLCDHRTQSLISGDTRLRSCGVRPADPPYRPRAAHPTRPFHGPEPALLAVAGSAVWLVILARGRG